MILGIKTSINKLMENTPWASNSLKSQQKPTPRIFVENIEGNDEYINMSRRVQGNYSAVFYVVFGTQDLPSNTSQAAEFYKITNDTMTIFKSKVPECFNDFILMDYYFDNVGTHQDITTGVMTGTFQINIKVVQKGVQ